MSFDVQSNGISDVMGGYLPTVIGMATYDLHCTNPRSGLLALVLGSCAGYDNHFTAMHVMINTNERWSTTERCDRNSQPIQMDIEKTLGHELLHSLGVDHGGNSNDLRFYKYSCGSDKGYNLSSSDIRQIGALYPWCLVEFFTCMIHTIMRQCL